MTLSFQIVLCLPGAFCEVMVTPLWPVSAHAPRPASYISVVWLVIAMAGATAALDIVRFTDQAWLLHIFLKNI